MRLSCAEFSKYSSNIYCTKSLKLRESKKCLSSGPNTLRHILPAPPFLLTQLSAGRILGPGHVTFSNSPKKRPICDSVMRFVSPNRLFASLQNTVATRWRHADVRPRLHPARKKKEKKNPKNSFFSELKGKSHQSSRRLRNAGPSAPSSQACDKTVEFQMNSSKHAASDLVLHSMCTRDHKESQFPVHVNEPQARLPSSKALLSAHLPSLTTGLRSQATAG